jgi:hypothetical protein
MHLAASQFLKHHRAWLSSTERKVEIASNPQSAKVFGKQPWAKKSACEGERGQAKGGTLVLCVMLSVSPAFANPLHGGAFPDKLAQWKADCFGPGLEAHSALSGASAPPPPVLPLAVSPRSRKRPAASDDQKDGGREVDGASVRRLRGQRAPP